MFYNRKNLICFTLVFVLALLQMQVLSFNEVYAQNNEPPTTEEVRADNTNEGKEVTDEASKAIVEITVDKINIEVVGTSYKFTAISESENLNYEWIIFKDSEALYKKEYSEENFLDFTMNEFGKYQAFVTIKDENGNIANKFSEEINIVRPIKINSIILDKQGKQLVNTPLHFSVSADGDALVYHWYVYKDSKIVYDGLLSQKNSIHYTPTKPGIYKGRIFVKDRFGNFISAYSEEVIIYEKVLSEKEKLEKTVNEKDFSSKTSNFIWVDTDKNVTYVFEGKNKNWNLVKTMVCTDGKASTPTVKGTFSIQGRGPWLTSYNGKFKAKYKVKFYGNYYFHSVLYDSKGKNIVDSRLGKSLSLGCIRLSVDHAKWIYDNIKDRTTVYVD